MTIFLKKGAILMEYRFFTRNEMEEKLSKFCELYRLCFCNYIDESIVRHRYLMHPLGKLLCYQT